tara:strand:+ start:274 stop:549 length:276 start_codon:yes stop_codon:yes gene_type:complete
LIFIALLKYLLRLIFIALLKYLLRSFDLYDGDCPVVVFLFARTGAQEKKNLIFQGVRWAFITFSIAKNWKSHSLSNGKIYSLIVFIPRSPQ